MHFTLPLSCVPIFGRLPVLHVLRLPLTDILAPSQNDNSKWALVTPHVSSAFEFHQERMSFQANVVLTADQIEVSARVALTYDSSFRRLESRDAIDGERIEEKLMSSVVRYGPSSVRLVGGGHVVYPDCIVSIGLHLE
jgi:hypothetical protein